MKIWKKPIALLLAGICLCGSAAIGAKVSNVVPVDAGIGVTDFGETEKTAGTNLNSAKWYYTDALSTASASKAYVNFSTSTTKTDRLISREMISDLSEYGVTDYFTLNTTFRVQDVTRTSGTRWGVAFGLRHAQSVYEGTGRTDQEFGYDSKAGYAFVGVEYNGTDYDFVVYVYMDLKSAEQSLVLRKSCSVLTLGEDLKMKIVVNTSGDMVVTMNNASATEETQMCSLTGCIPAKGGYYGFVQNGGFGVELTEFDMLSYGYKTPENTNIYEAFTADCYNAKTLYSQSDYAFVKGGLSVQNRKLVFENAAGAYMSTKYNYSNAEVAFDIPDMRREGGMVGNYYIPETSAFGVNFGCTGLYNAADASYSFNVKFFKDGYNSFVAVDFAGKEVMRAQLPEKFNIWSADAVGEKVPQVRILYRDGKISVDMKYIGEYAYKNVLTYTLSKTELTDVAEGHIRLYAEGSASNNGANSVLGNMSIDNLSITNFDLGATIITSEYRSNKWNVLDYDYVDPWDDSDLLG